MKNCALTLALAAAVVFGATATASAQGASGTTLEPTYELGLGYQLFKAGELCVEESPVEESCVPGRWFPFGVAIDAARNFGKFAIVGEAGWAFDSDSDDDDDLEFQFNTWHIGGGPRMNFRKNQFWPYAQVLGGVIQNRVSIKDIDDSGDSETSFFLQPGVGANFIAGDGWSLFGQADYRRVFLDEEENGVSGRNDLRLFFGVRMILD